MFINHSLLLSVCRRGVPGGIPLAFYKYGVGFKMWLTKDEFDEYLTQGLSHKQESIKVFG